MSSSPTFKSLKASAKPPRSVNSPTTKSNLPSWTVGKLRTSIDMRKSGCLRSINSLIWLLTRKLSWQVGHSRLSPKMMPTYSMRSRLTSVGLSMSSQSRVLMTCSETPYSYGSFLERSPCLPEGLSTLRSLHRCPDMSPLYRPCLKKLRHHLRNSSPHRMSQQVLEKPLPFGQNKSCKSS